MLVSVSCGIALWTPEYFSRPHGSIDQGMARTGSGGVIAWDEQFRDTIPLELVRSPSYVLTLGAVVDHLVEGPPLVPGGGFLRRHDSGPHERWRH